MIIQTIKTGSTLVSNAVPDRSTHKSSIAYTGLFQKRNKRIEVPVKCFYISVAGHHFLIDAGWSKQVVFDPKGHLGFGLYFASEPVMKEEEAAVNQLAGKPIDCILMTHLDCDHISGLHDFGGIDVYASQKELDYAAKNRMRYGKLMDGLQIKLLRFQKDTNAPFGEFADVFGDGSAIAYLTPTHSAGSVIYKIQEDGRFTFVVGDNGYKEDSWKRGLLPGPLYNAENMKNCLAWIKVQSERKGCCGVFCAHDPLDRNDCEIEAFMS